MFITICSFSVTSGLLNNKFSVIVKDKVQKMGMIFIYENIKNKIIYKNFMQLHRALYTLFYLLKGMFIRCPEKWKKFA